MPNLDEVLTHFRVIFGTPDVRGRRSKTKKDLQAVWAAVPGKSELGELVRRDALALGVDAEVYIGSSYQVRIKRVIRIHWKADLVVADFFRDSAGVEWQVLRLAAVGRRRYLDVEMQQVG